MTRKTSNTFFVIASLLIIYHITVAGGCKKDDAPAPPVPVTGTMTDVEGTVYKTIKIGNQVWMAENLRTTKYRDGSSIPYVFTFFDWRNLTTGARCQTHWGVANTATYGYLYNWYAVKDSRGLAPAGWHIPSKTEWQVLIDFLGGSAAATDKLKEAGSAHWDLNNTANNSSGFTALGAGFRFEDGNYPAVSGGSPAHASWWSSTPAGGANTSAAARDLQGNKQVEDTAFLYNYGLSVRCIKD
jgi:uncharacterized protein (TIGR02145 family)